MFDEAGLGGCAAESNIDGRVDFVWREFFGNRVHAIGSVVVGTEACDLRSRGTWGPGHVALSHMGGRDGKESTTKKGKPNATFMQQILT